MYNLARLMLGLIGHYEDHLVSLPRSLSFCLCHCLMCIMAGLMLGLIGHYENPLVMPI